MGIPSSLVLIRENPIITIMATVDVQVQQYIKTLLIPFVLLLIVLRLSRRQIRKVHHKLLAWSANALNDRFYNKWVHTRKENLFSGLKGQAEASDRRITILEIGAGAGANFAFFPANANLTCVDPNIECVKYAEKNAQQNTGMNMVEYVIGTAEDMSAIPSGSVDSVVSTLVLCSVENVDGALREVQRVLRPGGKFYFLEHIAADERTCLNWIQRFLNPIVKFFSGGCELTRKIQDNIKTADFAKVELEHFYIRIPVVGHHIAGTATKQDRDVSTTPKET